jgi:hypothetical protein
VIMLCVFNVATKANMPSKTGMTLAGELNVAAESFGHVSLSCSAARTPALVSTRSMVSLSAAARRSAALD